VAENYSSLPQCGSSKRLQLQRQDLKSNGMAASEDGGGAAVAEALGRKILHQEHGIRIVVGRRQGKDCSRGAVKACWAAAGKDCSRVTAEGFEQRVRLNVAGQ
jgi:hypothetical protein